MFLKLRPLFFSLIFFASLELIIFQPKLVFLIAIVLFFLSLYEGRKIGGRWLFSVLPVFFVLSSVALLYLIGIAFEQHIFIFLSSVMYYLSLLSAFRLGEYGNDQTAKGMNMAAASATIFFTYASAYGLYLNFLVPLYYLMFAYLMVTLLVSFQYFAIIKRDARKTVWMYSFLLALIMTEVVWTMNFWPFGYLTTGVIALILYYVLWDLTQSYFLNLLSRKRVVANLIFFSVLVIIVLLSAKWIPVL
ncbi:MAG: hypothetical protein WC238_02590 [Parcubacteria group bacterium]|jgi:hypothetical protein